LFNFEFSMMMALQGEGGGWETLRTKV